MGSDSHTVCVNHFIHTSDTMPSGVLQHDQQPHPPFTQILGTHAPPQERLSPVSTPGAHHYPEHETPPPVVYSHGGSGSVCSKLASSKLALKEVQTPNVGLRNHQQR